MFGRWATNTDCLARIVALLRRDRTLRLQLVQLPHRVLRRRDHLLPRVDDVLRLDGPVQLHH